MAEALAPIVASLLGGLHCNPPCGGESRFVAKATLKGLAQLPKVICCDPLARFGYKYVTKLTQAQRHKILLKAAKALGGEKVFNILNFYWLASVASAPSSLELQVFKRDRDFVGIHFHYIAQFRSSAFIR
jgi:hypothetical protein